MGWQGHSGTTDADGGDGAGHGTASGHLKVIGPAGSAIVASAPNTGRAGGRAVHNTLATIRSKTGLEV
jgi:hypothetical protein